MRQVHHRTGVVVLGVLLALLVASVALAATVTIDGFSGGDQQVTAARPNTESGFIDTASVPGGQRDMSVTGVSGTGGSVGLTVRTAEGSLSFSQDTGIGGTGYVHWDGQDNDAGTLDADGIDVDLTDGDTNDGFLVRVLSNTLPVTLTIKVYTATNWSEYVINTPGDIVAGSRVDFFVPFADFSIGGGTGAVFTDTGAVVLEFDGTDQPGADVDLDLVSSSSVRDFGDLSDVFSTTLSSDGARHIPLGLRLGENLDTEADGLPSDEATGDDTDGSPPDDEDGAVPTPGVNWTTGTDGGSMDVTVNGCSGTCYLSAWVDWARNSNFSDVGDQVLDDYAVSNGDDQTITIDVPVGSTFDPGLFLRLRLCDAQNTCDTTTGEAPNGEVEDHKFHFTANAVTLTSLAARASTANVTVAAVLILGLLCAGAVGTFARRRS